MKNIEKPPTEVYHGTTTVGLVYKQGVVLATDTRVTAGHLFIAHKTGKKIYQIDDHLAMTIAGVVADAQNIIDILRYQSGIYKLEMRSPLSVKSAARMASNTFFSSRLFPLIADVLMGGFDKSGPSIYNVDFFGTLTEEKCVSTGSGSPVAYGVLETEYNEGLNLQGAVTLAAKAVTAAMKRNAGTGDSFNIAVIDKDGYRELSDAEKNESLGNIPRR
ncbi:MAG: proteasome subunit beta [Nitrososphaerales archaeon]